LDEADDNSQDEVEGEDLMENMEQDYERNVQLDHYENQGIDDDKQEELSYNQRIAVEERLDQ